MISTKLKKEDVEKQFHFFLRLLMMINKLEMMPQQEENSFNKKLLIQTNIYNGLITEKLKLKENKKNLKHKDVIQTTSSLDNLKKLMKLLKLLVF